MSSPYVTLGNRPLEQWKVTELREELKKRNLATKGLKEDLLKRLDEAVRSEQDNGMGSEDSDAPESVLTPEQKKNEPVDSAEVKDSTDIDNKIDNGRGPADETSAMEDGVEKDKKVAGSEGKEAKMTDVIDEADKLETALSGSHSDTEEKNEDGYSTPLPNNDGLPSLQEDTKIEKPDPSIQLPQTNESTKSVAPNSILNLEGNETQDAAVQSTVDDIKSSPQDSSVQPPEYQVSEVKPDLGFPVTSDSVSTESISVIEKNELKVDVITDNVQLELDVEHEVVQPPASNAVPDGGKLHPTGVDEPIGKKDETDGKKDVEKHHDKTISPEANISSKMENIDVLKNIDSMDLGPPEKLSLDRSSGDDSMEEDTVDSKQMDYRSDSNKIIDNVENSGKTLANEEDHVDVVGHDKPVEMKVNNTESETVSRQAYMKRKFNDKASGDDDSVKKTRRLKMEGLKVTEPQSGSITASVTPRYVSGLSLKKRSGTDPAVNGETPKERIVPPSPNPPTNSLRIDRFLRPFTLKAVQELLGKTGTTTSFWMDHIKTHCYVSYSTVEEAVETRNAVYNLQWPPNGGRMLVAEFVDSQDVKMRLEAPPATPNINAPNFLLNQTLHTMPPQPSPRQPILRQQLPQSLPPPPPLFHAPLAPERPHPIREQMLPASDRTINLPPPPPLPERNDPPIITLDDLFRKTKATPRIYYLPLSDEQVAAKLKSQGNNVNQ